MRNFKITLEYDGTDYHGWQKQPGLRTVQGTLEQAVAEAFGKRVTVNGAGRTDAGVHALGQVCNFVLDTRLGPDQVAGALTARLPEDLCIYRVEETELDFHARFSARSRRYTYYLRTEPSAIWRRYSYVVTSPLDVRNMEAAARILVGEKDFASFTPTRTDGIPTVCNVLRSEVRDHDEIISLTLEADHFLHHMMRVIAGTLIEIGRGKRGPEQIEEIMCKKDRAAAGPTIPPNGLFLMEVTYD